MPAPSQLSAIPLGLTGAELVLAINDRLRRLNTALAELAAAAPLNSGDVVPGNVPKWDSKGNLVDSGHS